MSEKIERELTPEEKRLANLMSADLRDEIDKEILELPRNLTNENISETHK